MDEIRFAFWEALKTLSLAFLALLSAKAISALHAGGSLEGSRRLALVRGVLYTLVLTLAALGALSIGRDVAAELYFTASRDNLDRSQVERAYNNALTAVRLRPGLLRYWQMLATTKLRLHQFKSLLEDQEAFRIVSEGQLEESDELRFAFAHLFLGEYEQAIDLTQQLIGSNRFYAEPYVLQGAAFIGLKRYAEAKRSFLEVLQIFPSHEGAVEGLAHVYFLTGDTARALAVLDETGHHPFAPEARKRFASLKALYAQ